jgi:hypothetical protein
MFYLSVSFTLRASNLPADLVFLMNFEEGKGDTVNDLSGFGNHGTIEGKVDWIDGKYGKGLNFDGQTYVNVPNNEPLSDLTEPMSVGLWTYPTALGGWRSVVEMDATGLGGWKIGFHDSRAVVWTTYRVKDFIGTTPVDTDAWTHIAATWDGSEAIVYVNGEPDAPIAGGGVVDVKDKNNVPSLDIGRRQTTNSSYYEGGMDDIFIIQRLLSKDEINDLMRGFDLAIEPVGKLASTWGDLKDYR